MYDLFSMESEIWNLLWYYNFMMNNKKIKTAILISGRGSNMRALIEAAGGSDFPAEISA